MNTSGLHQVSMQAFLEEHVSSPRVRNILSGLIRVATYSGDLDLLSAGAAMEQLKHGQVLYVDNGWQSIVKDLETQALQAGVVIKVNSPVQEIEGSYPVMKIKLREMQLQAK